jgi:hypothetical protein
VITDVAAFMITIGFFASARWAHRERVRREPEPGEDVDVVARQSSCAWRLAMSGAGPGRIADDDLDLLPP